MRWFLILALAALLIGCDSTPAVPATPAPAQSTGSTPQAGYPAPQAGYPAPRNTLTQGPKFTINTPVKASDTQVAGSGPAGVPIKLIDMTDNGDTLAEAAIGNDGTFSLDVSGKLVAGNRIGLVLGEIAGTGFDRNNFISGPGYMDAPFIGIVFVSIEVEP